MSWSNGIRQVHRWISIIFAGAVAFVTVTQAVAQEEPAEWVYLLPLPPLALLFLTGLYLFVLPYVTRSRQRRTRSERPAEERSAGTPR